MPKVFHHQGTVDAFQPTAAGGTVITFDMYAPEGVLKQRPRKRFVNPGRNSYAFVWSPSIWHDDDGETLMVTARAHTIEVTARATELSVTARATTLKADA